MNHAQYRELLGTPGLLLARAQRGGKLAAQAKEDSAATAHHRHLQANARRGVAIARVRPSLANLNASAAMEFHVAESAESLAGVL